VLTAVSAASQAWGWIPLPVHISVAVATQATNARYWDSQLGAWVTPEAQSEAQPGPPDAPPGQLASMCAQARAQSSVSDPPPPTESLSPPAGSDPVNGSEGGVAGPPPPSQAPAPTAQAAMAQAIKNDFMVAP
jgi:hypothetical protein